MGREEPPMAQAPTVGAAAQELANSAPKATAIAGHEPAPKGRPFGAPTSPNPTDEEWRNAVMGKAARAAAGLPPPSLCTPPGIAVQEAANAKGPPVGMPAPGTPISNAAHGAANAKSPPAMSSSTNLLSWLDLALITPQPPPLNWVDANRCCC